MGLDSGMDYKEESLRTNNEAESEMEADGGVAELPKISPAAAKAALSKPMAGLQRQALVQTMGQTLGNKQVQRLLGGISRSASSGPDGGPLEQDLAQRVQSERSNGQPLGADVRRDMESSMGADLSKVRVHTGNAAAELNEQMGAKAFTSGRDVFFSGSSSPSDKGLLAHELTHTVQQGMSEEAPSSIGAADTEHEHAAEAAASGSPVGGTAQREADEDEVAMSRAEGEEDELAMSREEGDEDELAMSRDIQREGAPEEEELAMSRAEGEEDDLAMSRAEGEEDELAMSRAEGEEDELAMSRAEGEEDELAMSRAEGEEDELAMSRDIQREEDLHNPEEYGGDIQAARDLNAVQRHGDESEA